MNVRMELSDLLGAVSTALSAAIRFSIGDFELQGLEAAFEAQLPKPEEEDTAAKMRRRVARLLGDDEEDHEERFRGRGPRGRTRSKADRAELEAEEPVSAGPITDFNAFAEAFVAWQGRDRQAALNEALCNLTRFLHANEHGLFMDLQAAITKFNLFKFADRPRNEATPDLEQFRAFFAEFLTEEGRSAKLEQFGRAHSAGINPFGLPAEEIRRQVSNVLLMDLDWLVQQEEGVPDTRDDEVFDDEG